jgi:crossover junction endodeoxyribonuclease RusA
MSNDQLILRVDTLTTQTREFKALIGDFLHLELSRIRPHYGRYEVSIDIERPEYGMAQDVDSIAHSVLSALNGVVFSSKSRIDRLLVTKSIGETSRISVTARPIARRVSIPEIKLVDSGRVLARA